MFCVKCGSQLEEGSGFCPHCGAAVRRVNAENVKSDISKVNGKTNIAEPFAPSQRDLGGVGMKHTDNKKAVENKLLYTARGSAWRHPIAMGLTIAFLIFLLIGAASLFSTGDAVYGGATLGVCAIMVFVLIMIIASGRSYRIMVYTNKIVVKWGLISKQERQSVMTPILGVSVSQSVNGRMYNYGAVHIDKVGKGWDVNMECVTKPHKFKEFLETLIDESKPLENVHFNVFE